MRDEKVLADLLRKRPPWDFVQLALGLNIWASFLLLPAFHVTNLSTSPVLWVLITIAPGVLVGGWIKQDQIILLGVFPSILVALGAFYPQLVGANVFSPWSFLFVDAGFVAYLIMTLIMLRMSHPLTLHGETKALAASVPSAKWRRRFRIYKWMAALTILIPALFIFTLFLHPTVLADLRHHFPDRTEETMVLFGVLFLALWLGLFFADFLLPLRAHVRGDPQLIVDLKHQRHVAMLPQPRKRLFVYVAVLLFLVGVLIWLRYVPSTQWPAIIPDPWPCADGLAFPSG